MTLIFNYQTLGLVAAAIIIGSLLPACWTQISSKRPTNLSSKRLWLLVFGALLWIMYGIRDSSPAVVILSTIGFAVSCILLIIKLRTQRTSS